MRPVSPSHASRVHIHSEIEPADDPPGNPPAVSRLTSRFSNSTGVDRRLAELASSTPSTGSFARWLDILWRMAVWTDPEFSIWPVSLSTFKESSNSRGPARFRRSHRWSLKSISFERQRRQPVPPGKAQRKDRPGASAPGRWPGTLSLSTNGNPLRDGPGAHLRSPGSAFKVRND
jgi:hypothetical protein